MLIKIYSPVVTMYVAMSLYNITIVRVGGILTGVLIQHLYSGER